MFVFLPRVFLSDRPVPPPFPSLLLPPPYLSPFTSLPPTGLGHTRRTSNGLRGRDPALIVAIFTPSPVAEHLAQTRASCNLAELVAQARVLGPDPPEACNQGGKRGRGERPWLGESIVVVVVVG